MTSEPRPEPGRGTPADPPADAPADGGDASFEDLYARLEAVAAALEQGDLPLERAVALYDEGIQLARACQRMLEAVEQRVEMLREAYDAPF